MEIEFIFALLAFLFWGIEDFLAQKSARKIGDMESLAFIVIIGSIVMFPFVFSDLDKLFSIQNIFIIFGIGILHFVASLFFFESLKEGKLSIIDALFEFELPVSLLLGIIFFREYFSSMQLLFISFIFIGIVFIAIKSHKTFKMTFEKGVLFAVITAILMGFVNFSSAFSSRQIDPLVSLWGIWVLMSIFCLVYLSYKREDMKFLKDGWKIKRIIIPLALFATLAWLFYFYAVETKELGLIVAITEGYPMVAILLGRIVNKDKISWLQWIGIFLVLVSCISLVFV